MPKIDLNRYQSLYVPLAIFAGCLVVAAAIYGSGGVRITTGSREQTEEAESPTVAGEEGAQPEPESLGEADLDGTILDRLAKCLAEKGARLYVTSTCGWCKKQKELFGTSLQYINQVECYDESAGGWSEVCKKAEITGVPTWIFKDGSKAIGLQSLEALAEKTGCSLH